MIELFGSRGPVFLPFSAYYISFITYSHLTFNLGEMMNTFNLRTQEADLNVQVQPGLYSDFQTDRSCTVKSCLKKIEGNTYNPMSSIKINKPLILNKGLGLLKH